MKMLRLVLLFASTVSTLIGHVAACGGFFCVQQQPVVQAGEAIAFGVSSNDEGTPTLAMHVQILYEGEPEDFSWLLPVPFQPKLDVGSDILFQRLFQQTLPQFRLSIENDLSTTCNANALTPTCEDEVADAVPEAEGGGPGAVVLEQGSIGPFDFVVIEAADNNPDSVRQWLLENGYDEYEGSAALLNYYALLDYKFVALRLKKDSETGEIQPIVLTYDLPGMDPLNDPTSCVPIKLTAVAANEDMPVQVYVFGDYRAVPLNFFEVILDDLQVDWLGCQFSPQCFIDDLRSRFAVAVTDVNNHAFLTEYAGTASVMADQVRIDIDVEELASMTSPLVFLRALAGANVPSIPLVDTIVEKYIPAQFRTDESIPEFCESLPSLYIPSSPFQMETCVSLLATQSFDASALAAELDEKVFETANEAQDFVDSYPYMTRLYAEMSPIHMTKDPFFIFDAELPDVSNVHTATGIPVCDDMLHTTALEIQVDDGSSVTIPATLDCFGWVRTDSNPPIGNSPAKHFVASGYGDQERTVLVRSANGTFSDQEIADTVSRLDTRVVNQTVPEYTDPAPSTPSTSAAKRFPPEVVLIYIVAGIATLLFQL